MYEYLALIASVLVAHAASNWLGIDPAWLAVPLLLPFLPALYAAAMGAPFLPTAGIAASRMAALADLRPGEKAYDLGCGDGRLLQAAERAGACAAGFEISPILFGIAKWRGAGEVRLANFWRADLSDADVIFCFIGKRGMARFEREIWPRLNPGTRVVSNAFRMPGTAPVRTDGELSLYVKGDAGAPIRTGSVPEPHPPPPEHPQPPPESDFWQELPSPLVMQPPPLPSLPQPLLPRPLLGLNTTNPASPPVSIQSSVEPQR